MLIKGLSKTTLLDYPGRVAATIFTGGCNFRCPFCHNAGLVIYNMEKELISEEEIFLFLEKRRSILKGICITGGEPTLQSGLLDFIRRVKELGFLVKLDTNGYQPGVLEKLLADRLLDYVAMDIKNCPEKYAHTVGMKHMPKGEENFCIDKINESIHILKGTNIDYEFRTTVVKELHSQEDLLGIANWIKGCPQYFLQQYQENDNVIAGVLKKENKAVENVSDVLFHRHEKDFLENAQKQIKEIFGSSGEVFLRGIE